MPKPGVYVTPAEQPNAFATGRNPKHAAIAVTAGSSSGRWARASSRGVLAHEMAHIANRDILIASIAAMVAGAISAIANFLQFSLCSSAAARRQPAGPDRDAGDDHPRADRG